MVSRQLGPRQLSPRQLGPATIGSTTTGSATIGSRDNWVRDNWVLSKFLTLFLLTGGKWVVAVGLHEYKFKTVPSTCFVEVATDKSGDPMRQRRHARCTLYIRVACAVMAPGTAQRQPTHELRTLSPLLSDLQTW